MNQSFTCHTDGDSVWIEISIQQALDLQILHLLTTDSHLKDEAIFLCEDTDLGVFLVALLNLPTDSKYYTSSHWNQVQSFWNRQVNKTDELYQNDHLEILAYPQFSFLAAVTHHRTKPPTDHESTSNASLFPSYP